MITLKNNTPQMLSKLCLSQKGLTYGKFLSILKKKDIKVNGQKTNKDIMLSEGDDVLIYGFVEVNQRPPEETIYEDENIIIINKPKGIQVKKSDVKDNKLSVEDYYNAKCVHRLDRNTSGLLILAKNDKTLEEFKLAFENHRIEKYYRALCYGKFTYDSDILKGYLKKDSVTGLSVISSKPTPDSVPVITEYKVIKEYGGVTLIEVKLVTGKTHQIRAHMKSIHHSIVGDTKYQCKEYAGINKKNEKFIKNQCLVAYKLVMHFDKNSFLNYLDNKTFVIDDGLEKIFNEQN